MTSLYEQFACKDKEELYEMIKNENNSVKALTDFMEFSKADIRNKNKAISDPDTLIKYIRSTKMPTVDSATIVFVNTKNQPVYLNRTRLNRKNDIKNTIKEGLLAGGTRVFLTFNEKSPEEKTEWLKNLFNEIGMKAVDQLTYYEDANKLYSNKGDSDYRITSSYEIINDPMDSYRNKDFSIVQDYTDFTSYYAGKEMKNLNIVNDIENIKENLKIGYQYHDQEVFGIITYDTNDQVIKLSEMFKGGVDSSIVDLKLIAKKLLSTPDLKGFSMYHNHPSGNPKPSSEDIGLTNRMSRMCKLLDIELMEHFIVSKESVLLFSKSTDSFIGQNDNYNRKLEGGVVEKSVVYDGTVKKSGTVGKDKVFNDRTSVLGEIKKNQEKIRKSEVKVRSKVNEDISL